MHFKCRDVISISDFSRKEIEFILDKTKWMKDAVLQKKVNDYQLFAGKDILIGSLFFENSTRTRSSFEIAARRLGAHVAGFQGAEGTSLKKGESARHSIEMFEAYGCDAVVMRHNLDGSARWVADCMDVPVLNGGDGKHEHPTQTLLDLFSFKEHQGRLGNLDVAIIGDLKYGRTTHSLTHALSLFDDVRLHFLSPKNMQMPENVLKFLDKKGVNYTIHNAMEDLLGKVDVMYATRIQQERLPDKSEYEKAKKICRFKYPMLEKVKKNFGLFHPLPIFKHYPEIDPRVDDTNFAAYKEQAGNGLYTRMVLLGLVTGFLGKEFKPEEKEKTNSFDNNTFVEMPIDKPTRDEEKDYKIYPVETGTVIDHIKPLGAYHISKILRLEEKGDRARMASRIESRRMGEKDMLMIDNRELTDKEKSILALVAPESTINYIKEKNVVKKGKLLLPATIEGVKRIQCANASCVSRPEYNEHAPTKFHTVSRKPPILRCHYCDTLIGQDEIVWQ